MVAVDRAPETETDPPPFSISVRLEGDVAVSVVRGELDMATGPNIRKNLAPFGDGVRAATFDLVDLTFVDVTGLRSLLHSINDNGTGMSIRNPSRAVSRLLELVDLEELVEPHPLAPYSRHPSSSPDTTNKETE